MLGPPTINFAIMHSRRLREQPIYVMIYERVYGEIYDVPGILVHFDACADSVYQALFSGLGTKLDTTRLRTVLDIYMAVPIEEVNDAITFEQSTFS